MNPQSTFPVFAAKAKHLDNLVRLEQPKHIKLWVNCLVQYKGVKNNEGEWNRQNKRTKPYNQDNLC